MFRSYFLSSRPQSYLKNFMKMFPEPFIKPLSTIVTFFKAMTCTFYEGKLEKRIGTKLKHQWNDLSYPKSIKNNLDYCKQNQKIDNSRSCRWTELVSATSGFDPELWQWSPHGEEPWSRRRRSAVRPGARPSRGQRSGGQCRCSASSPTAAQAGCTHDLKSQTERKSQQQHQHQQQHRKHLFQLKQQVKAYKNNQLLLPSSFFFPALIGRRSRTFAMSLAIATIRSYIFLSRFCAKSSLMRWRMAAASLHRHVTTHSRARADLSTQRGTPSAMPMSSTRTNKLKPML